MRLRELLFLAVLLSALGCNFYKEKPSLASGQFSGLQLSFEEIKTKVIQPYCMACHKKYGDYSVVKGKIESIRQKVLVDKTMPKDRPLPNDAFEMISAWIQSGAPDVPGSPTPPEEPLQPTFSSIHKKILTPKCLSCHSVDGDASDVPFTDWDSLVHSVREPVVPFKPEESGIILFTSLPETDPSLMPPKGAGTHLSHEEIDVMKKWILEGALNN